MKEQKKTFFFPLLGQTSRTAGVTLGSTGVRVGIGAGDLVTGTNPRTSYTQGICYTSWAAFPV